MLMKVAWDNIDTKLSSNALRLVGKDMEWHGTIMISEQMPGTAPLLSSGPWRQIDLSRYPKPVNLIRRVCSDTKPVQYFNILFYSLVALFRKNLISHDEISKVSIDFLLKSCIKGHRTGKPAAIANLMLLDQKSNSEATARLLMTLMQQLLQEQNEINGDAEGCTRYGLMSADDPLYRQMQRLANDAPDGERNPDFKNIVSLPGQLHQSMALQDVVKQTVYDAGMDSLAGAAGLSPGLVEIFRSKK